MADPIRYCPVWWSPETGQAPCTVAIAVCDTVEDALNRGRWLAPLLRWPYTGFVAAVPTLAAFRPVDLEEGGQALLLDPARLAEWRVVGEWPDTPADPR